MTPQTETEGTARESMSLERAMFILGEAGASRAKTGHLLYDTTKLKEHSDALGRLLVDAKRRGAQTVLDNLPSECPRCHQGVGDYYQDAAGFVEGHGD